MRARTTRRAAMLVTAGALCASMLSVPTGAVADHSAPLADREWISQAGDGGGTSSSIGEPQSLPLIQDMNVQTVIFNAQRFPLTTGGARPGFTRYLAFGLVRHQPPELNGVVSQLAISKSENGLKWSAPELATIEDPRGVDIPFILNEPDSFFDVAFAPDAGYSGDPLGQLGQLVINYRALDSDLYELSSLHQAVSDDGRTWYADVELAQQAGDLPVINGPCCAAFNSGSYGVTDLIYQLGKSNDNNCDDVDPDGAGPLLPSPWNCRWVMLYDMIGGSSEHLGIASSGDGFTFAGHTGPILPVGAPGEWDDDTATWGKVRIRPNAVDPRFPYYDLYYSGGRGPDNACAAGGAGCWSFGSATSTGIQQGLTFTKTAANPVTPHELLEVFGPDDPHTLWAPSIVDDAGQNGNGDGHARIFYTRITNGVGGVSSSTKRDMYLAYTSPAPGQGPQIRISNPVGPYRNRSDTPVEIYLTDTLGTPGLIGVNMATLAITIDSVPVLGYTIEHPHLVTALKFPAHKVTKQSGLTLLADGPHNFTVTVADLQGNVSTLTTTFIVDTTPPDTKITSSPAPGPVLGFPLDSIGTFKGRTTDVGTGNLRIDVRVTNVLGMTKTYQIQDRPNGPIVKVTPKIWDWTWVGPTPDPQFLVPGPYTISVLGMDIAFNQEKPDADNTVTVLVI